MGIKHSFTSSKAVGADGTKVRSNDWNDDHNVTSDVDFGGFAVTNLADEAYNATAWDGSLEAPTKNAIRDKIEALVLSGGGVTDFLALDDTPDSYAGQATKIVRVNEAATALEFASPGWKNVMDYGAIGDGVADDSVAIQAAVDDLAGAYTTLKQGTIFFPVGSYKTTAAITFNGNGDIRFLGEAGAEIGGNFNGFIFSGTGGFNYSHHSFENLRLSNQNTTNLTSGCIVVNGVIGLLVKACVIGSVGGIGVYQESAQDVTCDTCVFVSQGPTAGSIGFAAENAAASIDSDYVGWHHGIRHSNFGLNVIGGRFEVNTFGIYLGQKADGTNHGSQGFLISGLSMESNSNTCIFVDSGGAGGIIGNAISGTCLCGINVDDAQQVTVIGNIVSGVFTVGIQIGTNFGSVINDVVCISNAAFPWQVQTDVDTTAWFNNTGFGRKAQATYDSTATTPTHQIIGQTSDRATLSLARYANSAGNPQIILGKSRGAIGYTTGLAYTVVQSGDELGRISFQGSDGTDFAAAGAFRCVVDPAGSPGNNDMPGRLEFWTTADGAAAAAARWYINMSGHSVPAADVTYDIGTSSVGTRSVYSSIFSLKDGVSEPATIAGQAQFYVDTADGDLKIKFGDGTIKTIVVDT